MVGSIENLHKIFTNGLRIVDGNLSAIFSVFVEECDENEAPFSATLLCDDMV